jgi:hypothetical protein
MGVILGFDSNTKFSVKLTSLDSSNYFYVKTFQKTESKGIHTTYTASIDANFYKDLYNKLSVL